MAIADELADDPLRWPAIFHEAAELLGARTAVVEQTMPSLGDLPAGLRLSRQ